VCQFEKLFQGLNVRVVLGENTRSGGSFLGRSVGVRVISSPVVYG